MKNMKYPRLHDGGRAFPVVFAVFISTRSCGQHVVFFFGRSLQARLVPPGQVEMAESFNCRTG